MWRQKRTYRQTSTSKKSKKIWIYLLILIFISITGFFVYKQLKPPTIEEKIENQLQFDESFTEPEKQVVGDAIINQSKNFDGIVTASVNTDINPASINSVFEAYLPITNVKSGKQNITTEELKTTPVSIWYEIDPIAKAGIARFLGVEASSLKTLNSIDELLETEVAIIPSNQLSYLVKLLSLDSVYYLDNFQSGAIFRSVIFSGESASNLNDLKLNSLPNKDSTLKINQTGVTALTREMMNKLDAVNDPLYFSKNIGEFLADADITHVSNEVSFKEGCTYSRTLFCSDPRFIETLKASGVDLVEITGNHNNDLGSQYNTDTINLYRSLGWQTVGGGLNTQDAAKYFVADQKQSKVAILAYNYPDSPTGGAIAGETTAGANSFNFDRIKTEIETAKQQSDFIIVDVQYWECYAYPDGYVEYPECDLPIGEQESVFKQITDLGADMVVGTSAHQPQIYEMYNEKPIYYGLGNQYFDQTQWPGTERGIILTHYFVGGKLIQTKLSPTEYDEAFQTTLMNNSDAEQLLDRLNSAR
jgi:poly-gamma-glutamate capsule biosynthesis protein CapA/YwtB (metallophosphatase superfamily)